MKTLLQTKIEEILNHHVSAFIETDLNEIMKVLRRHLNY
jgi:hypothetical protein